jgi:hypothetical protein
VIDKPPGKIPPTRPLKFVRDLAWLSFVAAIAVAWWLDRRSLVRRVKSLEQMHFRGVTLTQKRRRLLQVDPKKLSGKGKLTTRRSPTYNVLMDAELPKSLTFPSKCDWWLKVLLLSVISAQLTAAVCVFIGGRELWVGGVLLLSAGCISWILRSTYYFVDETRLLIRAGPFWFTVRLETIEEIVPTRNPLSSPALSLDRLCIHYKVGGKRRMVMISPADKESFLRVIAALVPGMMVDGSRAKRAPA